MYWQVTLIKISIYRVIETVRQLENLKYQSGNAGIPTE